MQVVSAIEFLQFGLYSARFLALLPGCCKAVSGYLRGNMFWCAFNAATGFESLCHGWFLSVS